MKTKKIFKLKAKCVLTLGIFTGLFFVSSCASGTKSIELHARRPAEITVTTVPSKEDSLSKMLS